MPKLTTMVFIVVGLMAIFTLAGLPTTASYVISILGISPAGVGNFQSSNFWTLFTVIAIASLAGIAGILQGVFGRSFSDLPVTAGFFGAPLAAFLGDLISIYNYAKLQDGGAFVSLAVFLIMAPVIVGYGIALYDWVRGREFS